MSTSGSKSNEHVAHFLVDIHKKTEKGDIYFIHFYNTSTTEIFFS